MLNGLEGHRKRLRERFLSAEATALTDEALLELILTYGVPRRDVRPLALALLREFSTLAGVVTSPQDQLSRVPGLGESSITLIKLFDYVRRASLVPDARAERPSQAELFELPATTTVEKHQTIKRKSTTYSRQRSGVFTNAVFREAVELLPLVPPDSSIEEARVLIQSRLRFSAEETRRRFASYIVRRAFPGGEVDRAMVEFARAYTGRQELRDICYYRFCKAEPLMVDVVHDLLLPAVGNGEVARKSVRDYLAQRFPEAKPATVGNCAQAIAEVLSEAGLARVDRLAVSFGYREIPVASFAFVLHSEFPEPGMYDTSLLEDNRTLRAMIWNPDRVVPALYELRNLGLISKVSEIDRIRQFTTKHDLEGLVQALADQDKRDRL